MYVLHRNQWLHHPAHPINCRDEESPQRCHSRQVQARFASFICWSLCVCVCVCVHVACVDRMYVPTSLRYCIGMLPISQECVWWTVLAVASSMRTRCSELWSLAKLLGQPWTWSVFLSFTGHGWFPPNLTPPLLSLATSVAVHFWAAEGKSQSSVTASEPRVHSSPWCEHGRSTGKIILILSPYSDGTGTGIGMNGLNMC